MRAAKYLGVAPWELLDRPSAWMDWALTAESAENEARDIVTKSRGKQVSKKRP